MTAKQRQGAEREGVSHLESIVLQQDSEVSADFVAARFEEM